MSFDVENLSYSYTKNGKQTVKALDDVSFSVPDGSFTCIIGPTGSGKSTLARLMCSLLRKQSGSISPVLDMGKISMVFQYPETQLFETTVIKDTMFGPLNIGFDKEKAYESSKEALNLMGISDDLFDRDPFTLSGGQKRKVAIAGIIAMNVDVLILDEPGAGLDPLSRQSILNSIKKFSSERKTTVFMITHNMDEVVEYADYVLELEDGKVKNFGKLREVMARTAMLPEITQMCLELGINETVLTFEEAVKALDSLSEG